MRKERETIGIMEAEQEHLYRFKDMDTLIEDFYNDIKRARRGEL